MRPSTGLGLAWSQEYNRHVTDIDEQNLKIVRRSKMLVSLFLQVLKYNERGGREKGRGKGKWKKGEGRKENEIKTPI